MAITNVNIINPTYTSDGIRRCFFFIAFICPYGVERKQLPAMFSTWPREYSMAYVAMLNYEKMNTNVIINDSTQPVMEHAKNPIIRVLYVRSPQSVGLLSPNENIDLSSLGAGELPILSIYLLLF